MKRQKNMEKIVLALSSAPTYSKSSTYSKLKMTIKKRHQMMSSFSSISIVDFEQVIVCWGIIFTSACPNYVIKSNCLSIYTL